MQGTASVVNLHNIKRLLERKCLSLPKNIKSQNKSVAMEIKLDRKKIILRHLITKNK